MVSSATVGTTEAESIAPGAPTHPAPAIKERRGEQGIEEKKRGLGFHGSNERDFIQSRRGISGGPFRSVEWTTLDRKKARRRRESKVMEAT